MHAERLHLAPRERLLVALISRYHRSRGPRKKHEAFAALCQRGPGPGPAALRHPPHRRWPRPRLHLGGGEGHDRGLPHASDHPAGPPLRRRRPGPRIVERHPAGRRPGQGAASARSSSSRPRPRSLAGSNSPTHRPLGPGRFPPCELVRPSDRSSGMAARSSASSPSAASSSSSSVRRPGRSSRRTPRPPGPTARSGSVPWPAAASWPTRRTIPPPRSPPSAARHHRTAGQRLDLGAGTSSRSSRSIHSPRRNTFPSTSWPG